MPQPLSGSFQSQLFSNPGSKSSSLAVNSFYLLCGILASLYIDKPIRNGCISLMTSAQQEKEGSTTGVSIPFLPAFTNYEPLSAVFLVSLT